MGKLTPYYIAVSIAKEKPFDVRKIPNRKHTHKKHQVAVKNIPKSLPWHGDPKKLDKYYHFIQDHSLIPDSVNIEMFRIAFGIGDFEGEIKIIWYNNRMLGCFIDCLIQREFLPWYTNYEEIIRNSNIFVDQHGNRFKKKAISNAKSQYPKFGNKSKQSEIYDGFQTLFPMT